MINENQQQRHPPALLGDIVKLIDGFDNKTATASPSSAGGFNGKNNDKVNPKTNQVSTAFTDCPF